MASRLELAHAFGQQPQRPVQAQVLVDALHRTGAGLTAVGRASVQAPFDEVLLTRLKTAQRRSCGRPIAGVPAVGSP